MNNFFKKTLIISPHPDDSEYSCYGIIKKFNLEATILLCSGGGLGDKTNAENRIDEVYKFWENQKNINIIYKNILNENYHTAVSFLDKLINDNNYNSVLVTSELDTNQDHRRLSQIVKSSLRNKNLALVEYWTPSTNHNWEPNVWIDISEFLDEKVEKLINVFKSQSKKSYFEKEYVEIFHKDWQAMKRNITSCEKFKLLYLFYS